MILPDDPEPLAARFGHPPPDKCFVCGDPIGEVCFCKIHRDPGGPTMLCCPDCAMRYLYSARVPLDAGEDELQACEKSSYLCIGEHKPWS